MTTQDLQGIADRVAPGSVVRDPATFLAWLQEQGQNSTPQLAPPQQATGGGANFLDFLTRSFIDPDVLDTVRDQGLFGRIGANIAGELTSPLGLASTALLATGLGAPLGLGIKAATGARVAAATARGVQAGRGARLLAGAGELASGALTPVLGSARGLGPSAIVRSPALLGRSLAAESAVAGGAIAGGGLAQEFGELVPGPTRSTPGQLGLGLAGGLIGAGATAGAFNRVLDEEGAIRAAIERANPIEEEIPGLAAIRTNFAKTTRSNAELRETLRQGRARQAEAGTLAAEQFPNDPVARLRASRAAQAGEILDRQRFDPLATDDTLGGLTEIGQVSGVTTETFQAVMNRADDIYTGNIFEQNNAKEAFINMMLGQVPTPGQQNLLRPVIGDAFVDQIKAVTSGRGRRGFELMVDVAGVPRTLMASFDASSLLRQGGVLHIAHPKRAFWGKDSAVANAFKASRNPEFALERNLEMINHPDVQFLNSGVDAQDQLFLHSLDSPTGDLTKVEEFWGSRLARKVPGVGASERFYITDLNEMRFGLSLHRLKVAREQTPELFLAENADRLTEWKIRNNRSMNALTGRGSLGFLERPIGARAGQIETIRDVLSVSLWSPRLLASRFQSVQELLKAGKGLRSSDPEIRALSKEIARDIAIYAGGVTGAITALSFLPGITVETNPKSSDFGKVRMGNTRFDPWAGFQQIGRYATQIVTGSRKATSDGTIGDADRNRLIGQFLRSKLAPGLSSIVASDLPQDIFPGFSGGGKNFIGEPITGTDVTPGAGARVISAGQIDQLPAELNILIDQLVPLIAQDIAEALEADNLVAGAGSGAAAFFGLGTSSYGENTKSVAVNDAGQEVRNAGSRRQQIANAAFR